MSACQDTYNDFARDLYDVATRNDTSPSCIPSTNAIISPISIQTSLMLAFVGAAGRTEDELRTGLKLGPGDRQEIAKSYHDFWTQMCNYGAKMTLKSVNRLFVNHKLKLQQEFKDLSEDYFKSQPVPVNFADANAATQQINAIVEQATENKIRDLLQPDAVNAATSAILINALYFKGLFQKPFTPESTMLDDFYLDEQARIAVDMMYQEDKFKYAELPELNARAVALPYEDSDISLLILLPNKICGLPELEHRLANLSLANNIDRHMQMEDVEIALPKFTIEYDLDLKDTLQQLGISELFGDAANLSRLFEEATGQKISAAKHRGYIDVNEAGSEAAAVTFLKVVPMSLNMQKKTFKVDHPFMFFIRNSKAVFFAGRFVAPLRKELLVPSPAPGASDSMRNQMEDTSVD
ncbi:serine protease inhibitor 42Dd-like [Drosophila montana]|uniref:serine protease inhibitor 42Dd-like n=1 Tax=Drosophila montana TaxID=40370 RepID=UPI00313E5633